MSNFPTDDVFEGPRFSLESDYNLKDLLAAIESGERIMLTTDCFAHASAQKLMECLAQILKQHGKEALQDSVYNVVFELVVNAVKGNVKRLFFEDRGLDIANPKDYESGMLEFKQKVLSRNSILEYGKRAGEKNLHVTILFTHEPAGLRIEVINNSALLPTEELRIRTKLAEGLHYTDIVSFYDNQSDGTEGEGLGLVLNLLLLKSEGLDTSLFRIFSRKGKTIARLEMPFSEDYVPIRKAAQFFREMS